MRHHHPPVLTAVRRRLAWILAAAVVATAASAQPVVDSIAHPELPRSERILWSFEADVDNLWYRPARAPDGTLYLHGSQGRIYALSADGALLWTDQVGPFPYVPPMSDELGNLYVGTIATIHAFSPEGVPLWQYTDAGAQGIQVGPTLGPDGRLYGAFDLGRGATALDRSSGRLEWSHTGIPQMFDYGNPFGTEMAFGPSSAGGEVDQLYMHMDRRGDGRLYGFSLDGTQRFATPVLGSVSHEPVVGSDGTIYTPHFGSGVGWVVLAIEPENGELLWSYGPENTNGVSELQIGPDDTIYFVTPGRLEAVDGTTGRQRWIHRNFMVMERPGLSPDGSLLVVGGVPDYGQRGFVKGFDAATGQELWTVDLTSETYPAERFVAAHHARFTPDGSVAYMSTMRLGGSPSDPRSYLFAIDTGLGTGGPALSVSGSCPGAVTVEISNAPPSSEVALVASANTNGFTLQGKLCPGAVFEIGEPFLLPPTFVRVDGNGTGSTVMSLPSNRCWLEALAFASCTTSRAVETGG